MNNVEELISDKALDIVWENANFGSTPRREIIANTLLKCASGYHSGSTATAIVSELGLVSNWKLTKLGQEYLFAAYSKGVSV